MADLNSTVPPTRKINTTAPLTGGGDLTADRTIVMAKSTTGVDGYLAATDFTTFNNKYDASNFVDDWRTVMNTLGRPILYESTGVPLYLCSATASLTGFSGMSINQPV